MIVVLVALAFFYSGYNLGKRHGFEDYLGELKQHDDS